MNILHLTKTDYKTTAWSGGTTTEIFIWPEDASYAAREFSFRISSARVDLPESDFTPLPGVERWITPLTGGFTLTHGEGTPTVMAPLDSPYCFDGGSPTHCVGTATDFNLMCKDVSGQMYIAREIAQLQPGFNGFYALEAGFFGSALLEKGDFLGIFTEEASALPLPAAIACHVTL